MKQIHNFKLTVFQGFSAMRDFLCMKYDCSEGKGVLYLKQSPSSGFDGFDYHINTELEDFYTKRGDPEINNNKLMLHRFNSLAASGSC